MRLQPIHGPLTITLQPIAHRLIQRIEAHCLIANFQRPRSRISGRIPTLPSHQLQQRLIANGMGFGTDGADALQGRTETIASEVCLPAAQVALQLRQITSYLREVALHLREITLHLREVPLHLRETTLHLREVPLHLREVPLHLREVPLHLREVPLHLREVPLHLREVPLHLREVPLHLREVPLHLREVPLHLREVPLHLLENDATDVGTCLAGMAYEQKPPSNSRWIPTVRRDLLHQSPTQHEQ
jgi:hypothetical protein